MNEIFIFFNIQIVFKEYQDWSCSYQERIEQWMKHSFSSKDKVCSNSIKTEAVFTKGELNNEWNIHFLQKTRCVQIVSRLKLYLPRQKWTINETFIFLKIQGAFKYQDWSCIYQDRNELWMKHSFSLKYMVCSKSVKTEAVFTKAEINNEWNIHYALKVSKTLLWSWRARNE